jgi:hypothetical protein
MADEENKKVAGTAGNSSMNAEESEEETYKERWAVSYSFPNGTIADMVYSKTTRQAQFAVANGSEVALHPKLMVDKDGNMTLDKDNAVRGFIPSYEVMMLADKNFVYPPSGIEEYGTIQDLFQEVRAFIEKYVILEDPRFYDVSAGYVLMTWVFDRFGAVPYLRVVGDLGTGKSRFLEVVGKLCNRAIVASGSISMAAVFRTIDSVQGTLVFDEADFRSSDMTSDIVKLLNGGHKKDSSVVRMEVVNDQLRTAAFRVFGPKIFGSRHGFEDEALNSRCIIQRFFPMNLGDRVSIHLPETFEQDTQALRNKLLMFRMKNYHLIKDDESTVKEIEFARLKQTALALTSVVKAVGEEQLKSVVSFLVEGEDDLLNRVANGELADVLMCIAWIIETDEKVRTAGQLHIGRIADEFNRTFYLDYSTRITRHVETKEGPLDIPGQVVSPRKIGVFVDRLGLSKERGSKGMFIPLYKEASRINALIERYRLAPVIEERVRNMKALPRTNSNDFKEDDPKPF